MHERVRHAADKKTVEAASDRRSADPVAAGLGLNADYPSAGGFITNALSCRASVGEAEHAASLRFTAFNLTAGGALIDQLWVR